MKATLSRLSALSQFADAAHFEQAKQTQAVAFLSKPYNVHTLQVAIEQTARGFRDGPLARVQML